jgi:hypothetical protein
MVYQATYARDQVDAAQDVPSRHAVTLNGTMCVARGIEGPCPETRAALRTLKDYGRLHRRLPGASRPEGLSVRPAGGSSWFGQARTDR